MPDSDKKLEDIEQVNNDKLLDAALEEVDAELLPKGEKISKSKKQWNEFKNRFEKIRDLQFKKSLPIVVRAGFLVSIMFLVVYIVTVTTDSNNFVYDFSERSALALFDKDVTSAEDAGELHYNNLYAVLDDIMYDDVQATNPETGELLFDESGQPIYEKIKNTVDSQAVINSTLMKYDSASVHQFGSLCYTSNGHIYDIAGREILEDNSNYNIFAEFNNYKERGCSNIYYDITVEMNCMAFFIPVRGNEYIDGLISIVSHTDYPIIKTKNIINASTDAVLLVDSQTGKIIDYTSSKHFDELFGDFDHTKLDRFIESISSDKHIAQEILQSFKNNQKEANIVKTNSDNFVFTSVPLMVFEGKLALISLNENEALVANEMVYIRHVLNISIIALIALAIGIVYWLVYQRKIQSSLVTAITNDLVVGCPNADAFRQTAGGLIKNAPTKYSLSVIEIKQYTYLTSKLGEVELTDLLKYVSRIIETFCGNDEAFGYLGEGKFVLLINSTNEKTIKDRISLIETVSNKHPYLGSAKNKRKFNVGICMTYESKRSSVQELINNATIACEKAKNDINVAYVIYNKKLNTVSAHNAKIESEMEASLANGDFKLFLQPKYNIHTDKVDSAEALVRWFDVKKNEYRFPGEFISLFETNGFIIKLDHFMFIETLEFISQAIRKGEKVVPISVNVSMVTVNSPDFLEFYIENKKNYNVGEGYITLEFTESFAMEDFANINDIISRLHENGIKCSLDDFGTGYSTLGVLKNIRFDELKFDRVFLQPGVNKKHDDVMLKSLIDLAKSLEIKTVQEGVENKEMYDKVVALGFDAIQGYYYAKAISAEEFKIFINTNTSIKFKSLVK